MPQQDNRMLERDWVVADASWSWSERLFTPLASLGQQVLLIKALDWRNAWSQRKPFRHWVGTNRQLEANLWERAYSLPPGWMKSYPGLGMRPIAWGVRNWRASRRSRRELALVMSYPHYLHLARQLRPDLLIYYNMDDYALYWPKRDEEIRRLEREAVRLADLSLFCSRLRAEELAGEVPQARDRIVHLPHGAPEGAIPAAPADRPGPPPLEIAQRPRPYLGFVGSLEDRVDWNLIERLAGEFPKGSIFLIGREPAPCPGQAWYDDYRRVRRRANVHCLGWRTAEEIQRFNLAFDVCLIPYRVNHPFNRVACPTKIMDYMATSRPIVSTDLPECQLYNDLFEVADDPASFCAAVRWIVERGSDDGRAFLRRQRASQWTWKHTARSVLDQAEARRLTEPPVRLSWRPRPEPRVPASTCEVPGSWDRRRESSLSQPAESSGRGCPPPSWPGR
jgi:hypothetical protein